MSRILLPKHPASSIGSVDVLAKKKAAETWCAYASGHNAKNGGKTWKYLLISHDQVQDNMTLAYYAQREGI